MPKILSLFLVLFMVLQTISVQGKPRARDLGIPFEGTPGPFNAITDVKGVEVGHTTLIFGHGKLQVGVGPVRTGVTAILPRGKKSKDPTFAGWFSLNGNGEMTGTTWMEESGFLEGPVMLTNTHSVGIVRDAVIAWQIKNGLLFQPFSYPVVAETYDGFLNDINGFHIRREHVWAALENAKSGEVAEGNVGGGTGMICYGFKGGIGTASRKLTEQSGTYTLGVLVQANFGRRDQLRIAGVPVGLEINEDLPYAPKEAHLIPEIDGSIIVVVATDAPVLPHQLKRIARRVSLGIARTGGVSLNSSGDLFIAFSTANPGVAGSKGGVPLRMLPNQQLNPFFEATVQATEEAIINALIAAETMVGVDDHKVIAIPHDRLREVMRKYNHLKEPNEE